MSQTVGLSDDSMALLIRQAESQGLSIDARVLAREKAHADNAEAVRKAAQGAVARILEISRASLAAEWCFPDEQTE